MKNIINVEVKNKVDNFWKSYREMVNDSNFVEEIEKCNKLCDKGEFKSFEEEKYVMGMVNLCEDVMDSIRSDSGYWGE